MTQYKDPNNIWWDVDRSTGLAKRLTPHCSTFSKPRRDYKFFPRTDEGKAMIAPTVADTLFSFLLSERPKSQDAALTLLRRDFKSASDMARIEAASRYRRECLPPDQPA